MHKVARHTDMKSLPDDITTDPKWEAEQQHRLLGFEILHQVLHIRPGETLPFTILEKTCVNKAEPNEIYVKKFVPRLLKALGVDNREDALVAIRRLSDTIR
jgi:hypothetical protein